MSAHENAKLAQIPYEAYNDRDFDATARVLSEGFESHDMTTGEIFHGSEGMRRYMEHWAAAFPNSRIEIRHVAASDEGATVEFTGRGTHTGPLETPTGPIAPTNRLVEVPFCDVLEIHSGKITSLRSYWDSGTMLRQLGVTHEMAPAAGTTRAP
jgi:steroid delta-isomerase-like uncharacterized protein